jgi:prepilin-type N-terminal cleavage/methylation domain-containing protein
MRYGKDILDKPAAGFTLIEVLLALMMFGIIAAAVFASFAAISSGVDKGRDSSELYQIGRGVLQRLAQDLATAYRFRSTKCTADTPSYICEPLKGEDGGVDGLPRDRLMFLTIATRLSATPTAARRICNVCYYIGQNTQGVGALFRYEECTLDDKAPDRCSGTQEPLELSDAVIGLNLTYYDDEAEEHETWPVDEANGALPCRVRIELLLQYASRSERFATLVRLPLGEDCGDED